MAHVTFDQEYRHLITAARYTLAEHPFAGYAKPDIAPDARVYPLKRQGKPARHLIIYRVIDTENVQIIALIHDAAEWQFHRKH